MVCSGEPRGLEFVIGLYLDLVVVPLAYDRPLGLHGRGFGGPVPFCTVLLVNGEFERVEEGLLVEVELLKRFEVGRREADGPTFREVSEQVEE